MSFNLRIDSHLVHFGTQFTKPIQPGGLTQGMSWYTQSEHHNITLYISCTDGSSDYFAFSTGRRGVTSLHTTLTLRPRHDIFQYAYQSIWGIVELNYRVGDELELDFTFKDSSNIPDCVWAVVAKDELRGIKEKRWDLVSLHS